MRSRLIIMGIMVLCFACYRPATINMRPNSFLNKSAANAFRQKDDRWLIVLELPNPSGSLNWGVTCDEAIEINLIKSTSKTLVQWYVRNDRWEKGDPFNISITTDNGEIVPVKISYSALVPHPLFSTAMTILFSRH